MCGFVAFLVQGSLGRAARGTEGSTTVVHRGCFVQCWVHFRLPLRPAAAVRQQARACCQSPFVDDDAAQDDDGTTEAEIFDELSLEIVRRRLRGRASCAGRRNSPVDRKKILLHRSSVSVR